MTSPIWLAPPGWLQPTALSDLAGELADGMRRHVVVDSALSLVWWTVALILARRFGLLSGSWRRAGTTLLVLLVIWSIYNIAIIPIHTYPDTLIVPRTAIWFWRMPGRLNPLDLMLGTLLVCDLSVRLLQGRLPRAAMDGPVLALVGLVTAGAAVALLTLAPVDRIRDVLAQLRNYGYLAGFYWLMSRHHDRPSDAMAWVRLLLVLFSVDLMIQLIGYTFVPSLFRITRYGPVTMLTTDQGTPQHSFWLIFGAGLALTSGARPFKRASGLWLGLFPMVAVGHIVAGFYKYPSLLLIGFAVLLAGRVLLRPTRWGPTTRWLTTVTFGLAFAAIAVLATSPTIRQPLVRELNRLGSGEAATVSTRLRSIENVALNLTHEHAWLYGLGVGRRWREYLPQPPDSGAWPAGEERAHLLSHWPTVHILLWFGLLGGAFYLITCAAIIRRGWAKARALPFEMTSRWTIELLTSVFVLEFLLFAPDARLMADMGILLGLLATMCRVRPAPVATTGPVYQPTAAAQSV